MLAYYRRRKWQPTPVFLPGEPQGREAWWVAVYGVAQSRTRLKWLSSSSSSSSSILYREGNGTPLQYSRLENPMDGGAWWAAVHGVAKTRTRLSNFTFTHWRRKWQPTPVFLPGESQGREAWWAAVYGVAQSQIGLKRLSSSSIL